jgi:hypothetical protein
MPKTVSYKKFFEENSKTNYFVAAQVQMTERSVPGLTHDFIFSLYACIVRDRHDLWSSFCQRFRSIS